MPHEVGDKPAAVGRVDDLGVELDTVEALLVMDGGGEAGAFGLGDDAETLGQSLDFVAVAHPDPVLLARRPTAIEEGAFVPDLDEGTAEFGMIAIDDLPAQLLGPQIGRAQV